MRDPRTENANFLIHGNGIMCCYDLFPTQFKDINEMTAYLPQLQDMGFNTVWINPIQKPGHVDDLVVRDLTTGVSSGNRVTNSIYAMSDETLINPEFSVDPEEKDSKHEMQLNQVALLNFTQTARQCGLVPIFDLVLNHVANDSKLRQQHPHWFHKETPHDFKDVVTFDYHRPEIRDEIVRHFWEPFLRKYLLDYGFDGVRVDAVDHIEPQLRQRIYELINEIVAEKGLARPVILDESLFSGSNLEQTVDGLILPTVGPSHVIISTYFAQRDHYGGLPDWLKHEEGTKAQVVFLDQHKQRREGAKGGCIAFSGNHDHNTLATRILQEMAQERLENYHTMSDRLFAHAALIDDAVHSVCLYSFMQDIKQEIAAGKQGVIDEMEYRMREKIAMCALTSSAGWYALSGDEVGDYSAKSVFKRLHAEHDSYYPQKQHVFFQSDHPQHQQAMQILTAMAIENIMQEKAGLLYQQFSDQPDIQTRLLSPYLENIQQQINSDDPAVCAAFLSRFKPKKTFTFFQSMDYLERPRTSANLWNGQHDVRSFIRQVNHLLAQLPSPQFGFWSEMIRSPAHPKWVIIVRKNGEGLSAETDLVIVNVSSEKTMTLTKEDVHQIACDFQQRVIAKEARHQGNPAFNLAYQSIMDCISAGRVYTDETITTTFAPTQNMQEVKAISGFKM